MHNIKSSEIPLPANGYFMTCLIFIFFVTLSSLCINKLYAADGVVLDSMEVVSAGRGGVNISHADNGALIHDNPAALVNMPSGKLIDLNVEFIYPEVRYEDPVDFDHTKHEVFIIPSFSFVYKNTEESRFAFGIGAFSPAGFGTEYRLEHLINRSTEAGDIPVSFGDQVYRSEASLVKILASTSFKVNESLSLGFSVGPAFQKIELEMPYTFQTGALSGVGVLGEMDAHDNFGLAYTFGAQYKISENTVVGFSYVSESRATLKGEADISLPDEAPESALFNNRNAEYDISTRFEWPRSIGMGISHKMGMSHGFSFDVLWFDWASAFDSLDIKLSDGDNAEFNAALGETIRDSFPLDWDSSFAFRFGYEYFLKGSSNNIIRGGYIYNENPVPDDTQIPLIPGMLKHTFSVGYSRKWDKWEFGIASQFMISDGEDVSSSKIVGGDFDESTVKAKAYLLFLGMKYRF